MTNALREELLRLSAAERMELVEELWDSIADELERESFPLTAAQREELERRIREREADPESSPSWEEVRARLWARTRE